MQTTKGIFVWLSIVVGAILLNLAVPSKFAVQAQTAVTGLLKSVKEHQIHYTVRYASADDKVNPPMEGSFFKAQASNGDMIEEAGMRLQVGASKNPTRIYTCPKKRYPFRPIVQSAARSPIGSRRREAQQSSGAICAFKRPLSEGTSFPVHASCSCLPRRKAELATYPATFRML